MPFSSLVDNRAESPVADTDLAQFQPLETTHEDAEYEFMELVMDPKLPWLAIDAASELSSLLAGKQQTELTAVHNLAYKIKNTIPDNGSNVFIESTTVSLLGFAVYQAFAKRFNYRNEVFKKTRELANSLDAIQPSTPQDEITRCKQFCLAICRGASAVQHPADF